MSTELINNIVQLQYSPTDIQRLIFKHLDKVREGDIDLVDASNPFVFAIEAAVTCCAANMVKNEVNNRKQYPMAAQNIDDLYIHMSDRDYANRFATPGKAKISVMFGYEELLSRLVLDVNTNIKKIVIPRNTTFTAAGLTFSLQYPIEIRQLAHGGIQVIYDTDVVSPLYELPTNFIPHEIRSDGQLEYLFFEVDTHQFVIDSITQAINRATEFKHTVAIEDQFYYARVYVENASLDWVEIKTTHSDQIYDPLEATAVIKVVDKKIVVSIPQIYINSGLLTNQNVRIDVYSTKGPIEIMLGEYGSNFIGNWLAIDRKEETIFTAPLRAFRSIIIFSDKNASGGANALSFEELRNRVVRNAIGSPTLPITNIQIEAMLERRGYGIIANIDNVTNRDFLATKEMPEPRNTKLITAAGAAMLSMTVSMDELIANGNVIDNGNSVTLTPNTIYRNVNGITKPVLPSETNALFNLLPSSRAGVVTNGNYLYTPFHYVLDASNNEFNLRSYYLDAPTVITKLFGSDNDTTLLQVGTVSYSISRFSGGYYIDIKTLSDDAFKQLDDDDVYVQLAYVPVYEKDMAYLNGVLLNKDDENERTYRFTLTTNFNVDAGNALELTAFSLYTNVARNTFCNLTSTFDIIFSTSVPMSNQWRPSAVDAVLGLQLLPSRIYGITNEKLRVNFGSSLTNLWSRARTVAGAQKYETHSSVVYETYQNDVYQRDQVTGSTISFDNAGNPVMLKLHSKGEEVLDLDGNRIIKFNVGDIKRDVTGLPILTNPRTLMRQFDLFLLEGSYLFATDVAAITYRNDLTTALVNWIANDLEDISSMLLEQTNIYFYPKSTIGNIEIMVGEGIKKNVSASQAFLVDVYMPATAYENISLREKLTKIAVNTISNKLKSNVVTIDSIVTELKELYGNDAIAVSVSGLGGSLNLAALTVIDQVNRCGLRKRLVTLADNTLIVEEDVTMNFIKHEINPRA